MIKKLFTLFKLGRKLAKSDILNVVSKFKKPPLVIKILFQILSFSFSNQQKTNLNNTEGERLSKSLQSMGTTFIKLGQFLVTRPDIIGDELAKQLEGLQDRLPAFSLSEAYRVLKPGGRYLCLEFSKIQNSNLDFIYKNYSKLIPLIGKTVAGQKEPYEYLIKSIEEFLNQEELIDLMKKNKFENCCYRNLSGGIVAIHSGWKI